MLTRAKTKELFTGKLLTDDQKLNTELNLKEINERKIVLKSIPRRLVFELTNTCNMNCIMCGRNTENFKPSYLNMDDFMWFKPLFDKIEEVTFMGWGEPTMHPNFYDMLKILDKYSARKYICTNGVKLNELKEVIFDAHVDMLAISINGVTSQTNNYIRRGSDLNKIVASLRDIIRMKKEKDLKWPYMSFVFCAMRSNLHELPLVIDLAADIGLQRVKVVYLTAFSKNMINETLWGYEDEVKSIFDKSIVQAQVHGIEIELPYISGEDPSGDKYHKDCFVGWRDFFLGSDRFIRPCMSTSEKLLKLDKMKEFNDIWNSEEFKQHRLHVNSESMKLNCKRCYQSTYCNWNHKNAFIQVGEEFSPSWE
ncbi:radical SAM protein [Wukongibacter baidiensis]|uniref:radical SAM protein n=1 Tax=Wukongibacter baidiensis TaxID=1723361 RepID=UPI003D7F33F3